MRPLRTVQHIGKQNAVVVAIRLVAKDGDVELVRATACENILHATRSRHAITNHDQFLFFVAHVLPALLANVRRTAR